MYRGSAETAARRYDVVLLGVDERRDIDEMLRDIARCVGLSIREVARLVREAPCTLMSDVPERDAKALVESLRRMGGYVKPRLQERQASGPVPRVEPAATSGTSPRRASSSAGPTASRSASAGLFPGEPLPPAHDRGAVPELPALGLDELELADLELPQPRAFSSAPPTSGGGRESAEPATELGALDFDPNPTPDRALVLDLLEPERSAALEAPSSASTRGAPPELVLDHTVPPADLALDLPVPQLPASQLSQTPIASSSVMYSRRPSQPSPTLGVSPAPAHTAGGIGMFLVELPRAFTTPLAGASVILLGVHLILYYIALAGLLVTLVGVMTATQVRLFGAIVGLSGAGVCIVASAVSVGVIFRYASHCYEGARSGEFRPEVGYETRAWPEEYGWPGALLMASMFATWVPLAVYLSVTTVATLVQAMPTDPTEGARIIADQLTIVPVYALVPSFGVTLAAAGGRAGAYWSAGHAFGALVRMPVGLLIVFALGALAVLAPGLVVRYALIHGLWWLALLSPLVVGYMQAVQASAFGILERNAPE